MRLPLLLLVGFLGFHDTGPFLVRLAGGPSGCAGRVEISYKGRWGSVCDDEWDLADAGVVCRQLDCGTALTAPVGAWFGEGAGPIWLNEVRCQGSEPHLRHCRHRGWRQHVCTHEEDASVVCSAHRFLPLITAEPSMQPTTGDRHPPAQSTAVLAPGTPTHGGGPLRLVGGPHSCAGRLEVLHGGQWGSVCDDGWGLPEGAVVCRELGCGAVQAAPGGAHFGTGTGPIWLDDVGCSGKEMSLQQCRARPWGRSNCQHDEDASVICTGGAVLRLEGGAGPCSGRLEVFHQGRWGTVCDDRWALPGAAVVCRELGCGDPLSAPGAAFFGEGSGPIWLDNVRCWGNESALSQCLAAPWGVHDCQHAEDAGVVCTDELAHIRQHPARPMARQPQTQKPRTQKPRTQKPRMQKPRTQKPQMQKPRTRPPSVAREETQAPAQGSSRAGLTGKWKPLSLLEPTRPRGAAQPEGTTWSPLPSGEPKLPASGPTAQAVTRAVVGVSSSGDAFHPGQHGGPGTLPPIPKSQQPRPEPPETHTDAVPHQDPPATLALRTRAGAWTDPHVPRSPHRPRDSTLTTVASPTHPPSHPHSAWTSPTSPPLTPIPTTTHPSAQMDLTYPTPIPTPITTHSLAQPQSAWTSLISPTPTPTPIPITTHPPGQPHSTWASSASPIPTPIPTTTHPPSQPHSTWGSSASPIPISLPTTTHPPSQPHSSWASSASPIPISIPTTTHPPSQPHSSWASSASPIPISIPTTTHPPSQPHSTWISSASPTPISIPTTTHPPSQPHSTWTSLATPTLMPIPFPTTTHPPIRPHSIWTSSVPPTPISIPTTTHPPSQPHSAWTDSTSPTPTSIPTTTHPPGQPHSAWTSPASPPLTSTPTITHPPSQPHSAWISLAFPIPTPISTTTHLPRQPHSTQIGLASATSTPILSTSPPSSQPHRDQTDPNFLSPTTTQPLDKTHSAWPSPAPTSSSYTATQPPSQTHSTRMGLAPSNLTTTQPQDETHSTRTGLAYLSQPQGEPPGTRMQCASSAVNGTGCAETPPSPGTPAGQTDAAPMPGQPQRPVLEKPRPATRALPATAFPSATPSARTLPPPATVPATSATAPPTSIPQAATPLTPPLVQEAMAVMWEPSRPSATKSWDTRPVPGAGQGAVRGAGGCREPGHESPQLRELIQVVRGLRGDLRALVHIQRQESRQLGAIAGSLAELAGAVRQMVRELPSPVLRGQSQLPPPALHGQDPAPPTESLA